jgi:hypothetical protein
MRSKKSAHRAADRYRIGCHTGRDITLSRRAQLLLAVCAMLAGVAPATTYTVTDSGDSGAGTLRQAIMDANSSPGADTIFFDSSVTSITLTSGVLPTIVEGLIIDGTENHSAGTFVELDGASLTGAGITITADGCEVYGMYIHGFTGPGISASGSGLNIGNSTQGNVISGNTGDGISFSNSNAQIEGNLIGTDTTGLLDMGNGSRGILITGPSATIRGNVVSGNSTNGIHASGTSATGTRIYGNIIGLGSDGVTAIGNGANGVLFQSGADAPFIGSSNAADRNIISSNVGSGVAVSVPDSLVENNYIGLDITGALDRGNASDGVNVGGAFSIVRGNLICGNTNNGINITGANVEILSNWIGLAADGATVIGNTNFGVNVGTAATGAIIGTTTAGEGNIISGNGNNTSQPAIRIAPADVEVVNNYIGTDSTGTLDRGNSGLGITTLNTASGVLIRGNLVSGNGANGMTLGGASSEVYGNIIGLNASGTAALPNTGDAIFLQPSAANPIIGSATAGDRNIISGNTGAGAGGSIGIRTRATGCMIEGNYIGTDITGLLDFGNQQHGIFVDLDATGTIRGNVISGNNQIGIALDGDNWGIYGNIIGLGADGTTIVGNGSRGLFFSSASTGCLVGSSLAADRNIISGNPLGLHIQGASTTVQGNYIGTDITGLLDGGSAAGILSVAANNLIRDNVISGHSSTAIECSSTGAEIYGNIIGLGSDGTTIVDNNGYGINITSTATGAKVGSSAVGDRNIVSGNIGSATVHGIQCDGASATITGNYVGTDATGLLDRGNGGRGISVAGADAVVNENVVSGNGAQGIYATATGLEVYGNTVGLGSNGSTVIRNDNHGIEVTSTATGATIGSLSPGDRNVVSGNGSSTSVHGIQCNGASSFITGNYVGTDSTGLISKGNGGRGLSIGSAGTVISSNVCSGNGTDGISANALGLEFYGNILGLGADGSTVIANGDQGLELNGNSTGAIVGSQFGVDGNLISGNTNEGISNSASGVIVQGNMIGTDITGTLDRGNGGGNRGGIEFHGGGNGIIGGSGAGEGNIIAFNGGYGGVVFLSSGNAVVGNTIHDNTPHGVVVFEGANVNNTFQENSIYDQSGIAYGTGWFGPISNDALDVDTGGNLRQNYPDIGPVRPGDAELNGVLSSAASTTYRLDFYRNTGCHPSGYGEAEEWLGNMDVTTDGSGLTPFTFALPTNAVLGEAFTATATDPAGSTSAISYCALTETDPQPSVISVSRANGASDPAYGSADFTVTFSEPVSELDLTDFAPTGTGSLAGTTVSAIEYPMGNALSLASTDSFSPASSFDISNHDFSIEFWCRRNSPLAATTAHAIAYGSAQTQDRYLHVGFAGGYAFRFGFYNDDLDTLLEYGIMDDWNHWACTFDNTTLERKIYRNGLLVAQDFAIGAIAAPGTFIIGSNAIGNFNGQIDEVRVWDDVRSQAEVQNNMHLPAAGDEANLLALYRFDAIQDLGVNSDGADDLADSTAGGAYPLDQTAGASSVVASSVYATEITATVTWASGDGDLGLDVTGLGAGHDHVTEFSIEAFAGTGETFKAVTNDAPTDITLSNNSTNQGLPVGTAVGTLTSDDPDNPFAGQTFSYALIAGTGSTDNARFQIVGNELQTNEVFDGATPTTLSVRVETTDDGIPTQTFEEVFLITVAPAASVQDWDLMNR